MILLFEHHVTHEGTETKIGVVKVEQTAYGTLFTPNLSGLPPGLHGFHVHATGNCGPMEKDGHMVASLAAGGHFDPAKTNGHKGPYGDAPKALGGGGARVACGVFGK